jgi:hypothetical protein
MYDDPYDLLVEKLWGADKVSIQVGDYADGFEGDESREAAWSKRFNERTIV